MIPRFRVWDKHSQKMFTNDELIIWNNNVYANDSKKLSCNHLKGWSIDEEYLMQSTGLKDKNGKEIFEGDIVKRYRSPFFKAKWEYRIEIVIKEKASLLLGRGFDKRFGTRPFDSPFTNSVLLEVIGNIYENPELLEDANET